MSVVAYPHIEIDSGGDPVIAGTGTKVIMVALDRIAHHWDAHEIHRQRPHLTLGQIHSALAYYYDHEAEINAKIEEQIRRENQILDERRLPHPRNAAKRQEVELSLKLYLDHNVHAGITESLRERGVDCLTAMDDGMACVPDDKILSRATALGRVVFSQDVDFLIVAADWLVTKRPFAGLIFASQLGIIIGQAIADLELMTKVLDPADLADHIEYIPLC